MKKKKTKKRPTSPSKKKASKVGKPKISKLTRFWLTRIIVIGLLFFIAVVAYLDLNIRQQFEGQKWALPAHVYTRPMELYAGQKLDQTLLQQELQELGYQKRVNAERVGTYTLDTNRIDIFQREFMFWDGLRPEQKISLHHSANHITQIRDANKEIDIVRLEPRLFASVSPITHEDRTLLKIKDVPQDLINALLAIEDRQFYSHFGINPIGIARAMVRNITAGKVVQGGSTLTQQLVKNYYLNSERTVKRKLTEMIMAMLLEVHYSKQEILQAYLNEVYLSQAGNRAIHGFALGSQAFFGRPLSELELPQLAALSGIIKGPSYYNPLKHPKRSIERRNLVLKVMFEQGFISEPDYNDATQAELNLATSRESVAPLSYPAFTGLIRNSLKNNYQQDDLQNDGLKIYTTLNPRIQKILEQAVQSELTAIEQQRRIETNSLQVAAVVIRTDNGEIAALIGDRTPQFSGYNRALEAQRPVGSLVKPFIYLTALQNPAEYTLATLIPDHAITVSQVGSPDWSPSNYDNKEHGDVMLIDALAHSYNLATVNLGMDIGVDKVINTLQKLGYNKPLRALPSLLLGAVPMTVMDVGQLYLSIATGGFKIPIKGLRSVLSSDDQPIQRYPLEIEQVIEPEYNTLISFALQDVIRQGTARSVLTRLGNDYELAGKTGTTDDYRDSWFAGFSGDYLTVVWVGRDDNQSTGLTGASGAARIWSKTMQQIPLQSLALNYNEELTRQTIHYTSENSLSQCDQSRQLPFARQSLLLSNISCFDRFRPESENNDQQKRFESEQKKEYKKPRSWFERIFG